MNTGLTNIFTNCVALPVKLDASLLMKFQPDSHTHKRRSEGQHSSSTGGCLPKWIYTQLPTNQKYLIKASGQNSFVSQACYESEVEVLMSSILELLGVSHVTYGIVEITGLAENVRYCISPWFVEEGWDSVSLYRLMLSDSELVQFLKTPDLKHMLHLISTKYSLPKFPIYVGELLLIDYIFNNADRHLRNIELLRCQSNYKLPPYFDFGNALCGPVCEFMLKGIEQGHVQANLDSTRGFFTSFEEAIQFVFETYAPYTLAHKICDNQNAILKLVQASLLPPAHKNYASQIICKNIERIQRFL